MLGDLEVHGASGQNSGTGFDWFAVWKKDSNELSSWTVDN